MTEEPSVGGSLTLTDVLADAADGQEGVTSDRSSWSLGGLVFAVAEADAAEFRLDPAVAAAARRTPDTHPSERGADWVRFQPVELDDQAIDRAEAWFGSAHRRALREAR